MIGDVDKKAVIGVSIIQGKRITVITTYIAISNKDKCPLICCTVRHQLFCTLRKCLNGEEGKKNRENNRKMCNLD